MQVFDELKFSGIPFTIDELTCKIKGKEERPLLLIEYLTSRNEELRRKAGIDITYTTYEKYERSKRYIIDFLQNEFKQKNYPLVKIDGSFLEKYFQYLRGTLKIGNNTAVKYMTSLKTLIMPAIQSKVIRNDPFHNSKFRSKTVYKGFLTDEDIELITKVKLVSPDLRLEIISKNGDYTETEKLIKKGIEEYQMYLNCLYPGGLLKELDASIQKQDPEVIYFLKRPKRMIEKSHWLPENSSCPLNGINSFHKFRL